jgi:hypothetical protein
VKIDTSHLDAIRIRLSHERSRMATSRLDSERQVRASCVAGIESALVGELAFLGLPPDPQTSDIDDGALLAELATEPQRG